MKTPLYVVAYLLHCADSIIALYCIKICGFISGVHHDTTQLNNADRGTRRRFFIRFNHFLLHFMDQHGFRFRHHEAMTA